MQSTEVNIRNKLMAFLKQSKMKPPLRRPVDERQLSSFEILPCRYQGKKSRRAIVALPTRGCSLFRRPQGGCLHCGLDHDGIIDENVDKNDLVAQFNKKLSEFDFSDCPVLCIYVPGSFLNDDEIDTEIRNEILTSAVRHKGIRKIIFESLPQYVTEEKVSDLKTVLPETEIEIALGLDTHDDRIRSLCINKNFSLAHFATACELLKRHDIAFSGFALLKPPFLTELEAIADTIQTCRTVSEMGAAAVSIEPNTVQEDTFTFTLFSRNLYRPPWLWSLLKVLHEVTPGIDVRVGGIVVYPKAVQSAFTCNTCSQKVWQKIQDYNISQDKSIFSDLDCKCKTQWEEDIQTTGPPLFERIDTILQNLKNNMTQFPMQGRL